MRRALVALVALVATAAPTACAGGDGASEPGSTTSAAPATTALAAPSPEFCDALADMAQGDQGSLAEVEEVLARLEASAPPELAPDVAAFAALARESATAFAPLGPEAPQEEVLAVLDSLSPEAQAFVEGIGRSASTGELPEGPAGVVLGYGAVACGLG